MNPSETSVTLRDIDIPFGRLVVIMLKVFLAAIPAVIIIQAIVMGLALVFILVFGGGAALLQLLAQ